MIVQSGRPGWTRNVVAIILAKSMEQGRCVSINLRLQEDSEA
jgi:hypothetical protein